MLQHPFLKRNPRIFKMVILAVCVVLGAVFWYWSQAAIAERSVPVSAASYQDAAEVLTQTDVILQLAAPANAFFAAHHEASAILLIISSGILDALGIFVLASGVFGRSARPIVGLFVLFALRQACQFLTALPPPIGMIWFYPGVPSLFVTYGTANDLFFSGHTALAVYGATELGRLRHRAFAWLGFAIVLFEVATVYVLRFHYTMDVFAAVVTALLVALVSARIAAPIDRLFERLGGSVV